MSKAELSVLDAMATETLKTSWRLGYSLIVGQCLLDTESPSGSGDLGVIMAGVRMRAVALAAEKHGVRFVEDVDA
jgi:hypothetical protein